MNPSLLLSPPILIDPKPTKMNTQMKNKEMKSGCGGTSSGGGTSAGPCGACKYLRRKCVEGCVFAPYFDAEQGAVQFAAVHRVFGASNASKLLTRIPQHRRFDAVVTLCYEALARVRDPVYGCVSHIFSLHQQVVNLQAELADIQARLSTLQCLPPLGSTTAMSASLGQPQQALIDADVAPGGVLEEPLVDDDEGCCDLHALSSELVYKYFSGAKFCSSD